MSEKLIDIGKMTSMVRKNADPHLKRLFTKRMEEEAEEQLKEDAQSKMIIGAPPLPQAQLVFNQATQRMGVAVRGAKYVCTLPKEYAGPELSLAVIDGERIIALHPNHPPLLIQPETGTTRKF